MAVLGLFAAHDQRAIDTAYRRGVDFLATAGADPPSYPVYTLSGTLLVLGSPRNARHAKLLPAFTEALLRGQRPDGGWSYFDEPSNLSSTLFAVGGLGLAGTRNDAEPMRRARAFVETCQNFRATNADARLDDGGFFHSPDLPDGNKAGSAGTDAAGHERFRSYGSMTADGVRALLRLGTPPGDPRIAAARAWLVAHFSATQNPGEFPREAEIRRASGYFYWTWSAAHAMRALGERSFAQPLAEALLALQKPDGSWTNTATEMREDDPLVATPLGAAALAVSRAVLTGELRSHAADAYR